MSLPEKWKVVNIFDICEPKQWKTIPIKNLTDEGYVVYGANGKIGYYSSYTHKEPTLMITCRGASCGNIHVSEPFSYINGNAMALDNLTASIDLKFTYYYLISRSFDDVISGTAQPQITQDGMKVIDVPLPPLNEQKRIAKKLDELLATVESIKTRLDNAPNIIKRFRQSILAAATSGKLTEEWREENGVKKKIEISEIIKSWAKIYEQNGKKYQKPKLELKNIQNLDLPYSWNLTQLGYVFDIYVGATPSRKNVSFWNGNIPWVSSGEVAFNSIEKTKEYITEDGLKNTSTNVHPVGTVLLAMIGQGKTRGQSAILNIEACHNQNTAALRVNSDYCDSKYLYFYLWERYEKTRELGSGNNQKALNKKAVQSLQFPLPPLEEQKEIVSKVESLFALADTLEAKIEAAKKRVDRLSQSILAKAFRGELVPQDPNDEPAEKLLERIRVEQEKKKTKKARRKM